MFGAYLAANKMINSIPLEEDTDLGTTTNDGPIPAQAEVTKRVYFDVTIDGHEAGRIIMGLYGSVVPKTTANFEALCKGDQTHPLGAKLDYQGSPFHRIIPGFMIQGKYEAPKKQKEPGFFFFCASNDNGLTVFTKCHGRK